MAGSYGTVTKAGRAFKAGSMQNRRTGPSNKNLGPSRVSKPNPAPTVRSLAGRAIKGPDLGAGGR
jgi:hypothetical protein